MIKKEVVVIGVGRFGKEIISKLSSLSGYSIVAIDKDASKLEQLQNLKNVIVGDASSEEFLLNIGIDNADYFIIGMGQDFQASLTIASTLNENYKGKIIVKSVSEKHETILNRLGIKNVITPEVAAAKRVFNLITNPLFVKNSEEFNITEIAEGISVARMPVRDKWIGKQIKEIDLPKDITIFLIFRKGKKPEIGVGSTELKENDILAIAGNDEVLLKIIRSISKELEESQNNQGTLETKIKLQQIQELLKNNQKEEAEIQLKEAEKNIK